MWCSNNSNWRLFCLGCDIMQSDVSEESTLQDEEGSKWNTWFQYAWLCSKGEIFDFFVPTLAGILCSDILLRIWRPHAVDILAILPVRSMAKSVFSCQRFSPLFRITTKLSINSTVHVSDFLIFNQFTDWQILLMCSFLAQSGFDKLHLPHYFKVISVPYITQNSTRHVHYL